MARETKAQRLARETAEREQQAAINKSLYPTKLMQVLERAQYANFELQVRETAFVLYDRDAQIHKEFHFVYPTYSAENQEKLDDLEFQVEIKERDIAEAEEKYRAKQAALAKLTTEERALLNL